jgi:hypothetical protein
MPPTVCDALLAGFRLLGAHSGLRSATRRSGGGGIPARRITREEMDSIKRQIGGQFD